MVNQGSTFCTTRGPPFEKVIRAPLVKAEEVVKGEVNYKWLCHFNGAQVSGTMDFQIKASGEFMMVQLLGRNREWGVPGLVPSAIPANSSAS